MNSTCFSAADDQDQRMSLIDFTACEPIFPNPPKMASLSVEKEVLNRRVRTSGLPPDYVDQ